MSSPFVSITGSIQPEEENPKKNAFLKKLGVGVLAASAVGALAEIGTTVIPNLYAAHEETRQLRGDFGPAAAAEARLQKAAREAVAKGTPLQVYLPESKGPAASAVANYKAPASSLFRHDRTVALTVNDFTDVTSPVSSRITIAGSNQTLDGKRETTYFGSTWKGQISPEDLKRAMAGQLKSAAGEGADRAR